MLKSTSLLILAVFSLYCINQFKVLAERQAESSKVIKDLTTQLETKDKAIKTLSCVLNLMTKVSSGDKATIKLLDGPCTVYRSSDEVVFCVNQQVRQLCGLE